MSTTLYSQRLPPPPPPAGMAEGGVGHPAPLTRENITLLQALTQPSRLRRRVAPNFEVVSYDDPDGMEYSLSRFRPADSQDAAPASERTVAAGEATGRPRHGGAGGGRGDRYSGQDGDERPSQRSHPARPPPPLPAGRERAAPDSQGQGRSSNNNNNNDNGYPSGTAGGDDGGRRAPAQGGRLNMQALEDQFGRGQDDSRGLRGARREDLSQRPIYASRDSDDDSYRKRPMSHNLPASQWDEVRGGAAAAPGQNRGNDYNVDSSRPARFQEHLQASGDDDGYGRGRRGQHHSSRRETEEAKGAVNYDDYEEEEREDTDVSNTSGHHRHPRRPLRDAWQADHSDQGSNDDVDGGSRDGYGGRQQRHPDHRNGGGGGGDDDDEYRGEEEEADPEALSGDVLSCDEYDRQVAAAAKDRVPRQPPQQQRQPPPPPPKAPVRGQAYPRGAPLHNTRDNVTEPQATGSNRKKDKGSKSKKPTNARHNPKAFQNKTTYSWISTNTTTTVILPAATVQLMPVHGFAPVVEEVLEHDGTRWALPPAHSSSFPPAGQQHHHHHQQQQQQYMLNAPQSAGYPHRPSQMTVLDDSDEVTGRVGSSLPQLGRRGYDSGSYARDSMSEL